jgi:hypothetical protein
MIPMRLERARRPWLIACLVSLCLLATTAPALADDAAIARTLFKEGRELVVAGQYEQACRKFEESLRLDAGIGTEFNLADCWARVGRTASAYQRFMSVAALAKSAGQADRARVALERAEALEPKRPRLVIHIKESDSKLVVTRDGAQVDRGDWGEPVPVDPGEHVIDATAPRKKPWTTRVTVPDAATVMAVEVPVLESVADAPSPSAAPKQKPSRAGRRSPPRADPANDAPPAPKKMTSEPRLWSSAGLVLGGVGIAGLAVGTVAAVTFQTRNSRAKDICPAGYNCTLAEIDKHDRLLDEAKTARNWALVGFGVGAVALAGGTVLYLSDPARQEGPSRARWSVGPAFGLGGWGAVARGSW